MQIPAVDQTITASSIMDIDDNVNEADIKYWHIGDSSIIEKVGLKKVEGLK